MRGVTREPSKRVERERTSCQLVSIKLQRKVIGRCWSLVYLVHYDVVCVVQSSREQSEPRQTRRKHPNTEQNRVRQNRTVVHRSQHVFTSGSFYLPTKSTDRLRQIKISARYMIHFTERCREVLLSQGQQVFFG